MLYGQELASKRISGRLLDRRAGRADRCAVHPADAGRWAGGRLCVGPGRRHGRRNLRLDRRLRPDVHLGHPGQPAGLAAADRRAVPVLPGRQDAAGAPGRAAGVGRRRGAGRRVRVDVLPDADQPADDLCLPGGLRRAGAGQRGGGAHEGHPYAATALLVLGVFAGSALWWLLLSGGVGLFRSRFNVRALRWVNWISGAIIAAFGLLALVSLVV